MSSTKALLKAVGEAIKQKKWDIAIQNSKEALQQDPKSYQAHIFLAFALDKENRLDEAEATYLSATNLKPGDSQAWQGLTKLYPRLGNKKLSQYQHATLKLAEIYRDMNEMHKCQEVVDKFIDYARTSAERPQYVDALDLILPESPIYAALDGRVPPPAATYQTQAQIVEAEEAKRINTLIGERRTRIGARFQDVTLEVRREVYQASRLSYIYSQLINWSTNDEVRRTYEEKLLQYCYDRLLAWPAGEQKQRELGVVQKLANDMVIIRHPFKLAWDIAVDWKDCKEIGEWDVTVLRDYCSFFPGSDLQRVLTGFLTSSLSPFPKETTQRAAAEVTTEVGDDESEDDEDGGAPASYVPTTEEDRLFIMAEGINTAESLLAFRLMGEYYQYLEEHESNVELMRKALDLVKEVRSKTGLALQNTTDALSLYLGTALVFYQTPRHHGEARALFESVLEHDVSRTSALIGVGLIYEEEEEYDGASDFLTRALARDPSNLRVRTEAAWVKALKGDYASSKEELEACVPLIREKGVSAKELLAQTQYRLGRCIWNMDASKAARKNRAGAYACFLDALKNDLNYAPAYTSLGVYYADYARDKKRARKCFHKAVELSSSEVESAERLARSFADDGDWDRVELVARRVVDSGKVKPPPGSKRKGISWPFAALGVAELNKQAYAKAIVSFQAALRMTPEDYHSWVGLGESYFGAGRYVAATKAILNARKLEETAEIAGDTWFTTFMLANIKRNLGDYDDAISLYNEISGSHAEEEGVALALMQTMAENAWDCIEKGFFGKSVRLATEAISFAARGPVKLRETFNFWKAVADACAIFTAVQSRAIDFPTDLVRELIGSDDKAPEYETLREVDGVGTGVIEARGLFADDERLGVDLTRCLQATILAHKRALHASANDMHAQAVAHYNLGWAEHQAHTCLPAEFRDKSSRYLKAAVRCFKRAIELEAGNAEFWNALGVVTSAINPAVAQHAFVRSLHLDERSAVAWTNLGTLALLQNDIQLANEALTRAQATDPDCAQAWVGQGLIALLVGDVKEARGLFTHAMEIAEASSIATRRHYSVSLFDYVLSSPPELPIAQLIQPVLALGQLQRMRPQDMAYGHLRTLFQERTGDCPGAAEALEAICAAAETDYEATESAEALRHFALAKTDLARCYLAAGEYERAVEAGELALQLSSIGDGNGDGEGREMTVEERRRARLSAHLTVGLAQYHAGDAAEAVACLEAALEESDGNADAACALAQVLWATGDEAARERAREMLFGVVSGEGADTTTTHVPSVLLLGVIALLDGDAESLDAVGAELKVLRAGGAPPAEQGRVGDVLRAIAALRGRMGDDDGVDERRETGRAVLSQAQADVMLYPYLPHGWLELAATGDALDGGDVSKVDEEADVGPADMAVRVARRGVPPRGNLSPEDLARAYAGTGRAADAQVAIVAAPWEVVGWVALGEAVTA